MPRPRSVANPVLASTVTSIKERILSDCYGLYSDSHNGLLKISSDLSLDLLPPSKKIFVMVVGNHSAGKSSFINWYIEEHIQKTGVAIETQGFTFITSGRKRESLTGTATLHLFPLFKQLSEFKGVMDYLTAEISTSIQKKFGLVTFIDTPGLVDGDMKYPFDVNKALVCLGEQVDLIFVFFDPMGQALCRRTLDIVEKMSEKCEEKLRYYLSKADEAGKETDRQKVMMQIVQELCRRPTLNKCGFEMSTIYIPEPQRRSRCINQIDEVCKTIEKTIDQTVQKTLSRLENDCHLILDTIDNKFKQDRENRISNKDAFLRVLLFGVVGVLLPFLVITSFIIYIIPPDVLENFTGVTTAVILHGFLDLMIRVWNFIPEDCKTWVLFILAGCSYLFFQLAKYYSRTNPVLSKRERNQLENYCSFIKDYVQPKQIQLYEEFLHHCTAENELSSASS